MGRRLERVENMAGEYTQAAGKLALAFGLVPLLWERDGWSGVMNRAGLALPVAAAGVLVVTAARALKVRRARRRGVEKVTGTSEPAGE